MQSHWLGSTACLHNGQIVKLCHQTRTNVRRLRLFTANPAVNQEHLTCVTRIVNEPRIRGFFRTSHRCWLGHNLTIAVPFTRHSALLCAASEFLGQDISHVALVVNVITMSPDRHLMLTVSIQHLVYAFRLETRQCPVVCDVAQLDRDSLVSKDWDRPWSKY